MLDKSYNELAPIFSFPSISVNEAIGERHIYYRLSDSEIFKMANEKAPIDGEKIVNILPKMTVEGQGFIHIPYDKLDKILQYELFDSNRFKISCKNAMKKMLSCGYVDMVYSETYKIPTSFPYIIQQSSNSNSKKVRVIVNISDFVVMDQYGTIKVQQIRNYNGLMAVLFAACSAYAMVSGNITLPSDLSDGIILMYANMLDRTINGIVHMDPIMREKVRYLSTEFALVQMYGTEKGTLIFERYKKKFFPKLGDMITDSIDATFRIDYFDSLTLFIDELKTQYPIMKHLSLGVLFDRWIRTYGTSTALSLDYLGYHIYTICMLLFESPLVSRISLESALDQSKGTDAYKRLQTIIDTF